MNASPAPGKQWSYTQAINAALAAELEGDLDVILFGEDVAAGGAFGATKGLFDRFGDRVRNTPISEGAIVGLATGAAAAGLRPVVEVMFIDFITLAMDVLVNHTAKLRFMSGGQLTVPLVLRTQDGPIQGAGAQHSQSLESWLTHVPGLKVVTPATPNDVWSLLRASIRDDDPVVFIESKGCYTHKEERAEQPIEPLGTAKIRRAGSDLTIVTWGGGLSASQQIAENLASHGIQAEVIDLRTLVPLDTQTILESASRTGRVVVYHEAVKRGGYGAEVAAAIQEEVFHHLSAPVLRFGARSVPIPAATHLERAVMPDVEHTVDLIRRSLRA
jgi:pyruvate/2-oxoglutarate/acetoin dehydrogenase E1 component